MPDTAPPTCDDPSTWHADSDGDGYGDAAVPTTACTCPSGHVVDATDCDDTHAEVHPGAPEVCDGLDNDCDGLQEGQDPDLVDGITWCQDTDRDGYGDPATAVTRCSQPAGYITDCTDCDDTDPRVRDCGDTAVPDCDQGTHAHPAASCAALLAACPTAATGTWWIDPDGDGSAVEVTCDMDQEGGGWTVLADLDFAVDACPGAWAQHASEHLCYGYLSSGGERSATFDAYGLTWSEALVELCMRQYRTDDGFSADTARTLDDPYADGFSLTLGVAGARTHLFSWAIGNRQTSDINSCPDVGGKPAPAYLSSDWACESGNPSGAPTSVWYTPRLFEGTLQHLTLSTSTRDDPEGRIMFDQPTSDEDIGVCGIWLAVR